MIWTALESEAAMRAAGFRTVLTRVALAAVASAVIAACGTQPLGGSPRAGPTQTAGVALASPTRPAADRYGSPASQGTLTLGIGDNGKTLCVTTGTAVLVFLHGSAGSRWASIRVSSADLAPHVNPAFILALWVTGGSYLALHPSTVVISSSRPACGPDSQPSGSRASRGANCPSVTTVFRVTLLITP